MILVCCVCECVCVLVWLVLCVCVCPQVGGVRTNFSMPDVLSLELGGGSTCVWDSANVSHTFFNPFSELYIYVHSVTF